MIRCLISRHKSISFACKYSIKLLLFYDFTYSFFIDYKLFIK
nr:MAG TPA: hypothetical protein [Herelleviridae sp.]